MILPNQCFMSIFLLMILFYTPQAQPQHWPWLIHSAFDASPWSLLNHRPVLNAERTKCMLFSTSTSFFGYPAIKTLNSTQITLAQSAKYLGIWIWICIEIKDVCLFPTIKLLCSQPSCLSYVLYCHAAPCLTLCIIAHYALVLFLVLRSLLEKRCYLHDTDKIKIKEISLLRGNIQKKCMLGSEPWGTPGRD